MMKLPRRIISLLLIVITVFSLFTVSVISFSAATNSVVTTDAVRLRSSAEITSDNTITALNSSEELTLLKDSSDGWAYVSRKDGTKGYCSISYLAVPSGSQVTISGVTTDDVYLRKGASVDYDYIKLLPSGTSFTVTDNTNELWVKAKVGTSTGYIYRTYTKLSIALPKEDTPTTETPTDPDSDREVLDWQGLSALENLLGQSVDKTTVSAPVFISLADATVTIEEGQKYTLTAYTNVASASSAVSFRSSDTSVATVTANGTVEAKSVGKATITAYMDGCDSTALCRVEVIASTTIPEEDELQISDSTLTMGNGNHYQLTANFPVSWKSSDTSVLTVSNGIITAKGIGTATVTASTDGQSKTCTVTVKEATSKITISKSAATVTVGKTYYNGASSTNKVTWTSSDTDVATVNNGFITAVSAGKAVITAKNSDGEKTCLVTVQEAEPVRFVYSSPNTAAIGETITLYAVTDTNRTAVKFEVSVGSKTVTVNADKTSKDGNTFLWSGTTVISSDGTFNVVAYAKTEGGGWKTCSLAPEDGKTTVFVRKTADKSAETMDQRRASDEAITLIAGFEGYSSSVYFDQVANNIPTLGYGKVLYIGDSFYNDMTRNEAYAYLVQAINNDGYTSSVNSYLDKYNINRNQQQFDALISFVYNLGSNILSGDSEFKNIFTAAPPVEGAGDTDAYINAASVNLRSGPATSYSVVTTLNTGDLLTLVETEPENNWYHVKTADGKEGYVYSDYVTKGLPSTATEFYLSDVDKAAFTKLMLQYHHAGPTCVWGLLYRRVDELEVFFSGDYVRDGSKNKNNYSFTCTINSSTVL